MVDSIYTGIIITYFTYDFPPDLATCTVCFLFLSVYRCGNSRDVEGETLPTTAPVFSCVHGGIRNSFFP